jgi:hypothetical protein
VAATADSLGPTAAREAVRGSPEKKVAMAPVANTLSPDGTTAQEAVKCSADDLPSAHLQQHLTATSAAAAANDYSDSTFIDSQATDSAPYADDVSLLSPVIEEVLHSGSVSQDGAGAAADGKIAAAAAADECHPAEHAAIAHEAIDKLDKLDKPEELKHRTTSGAGGVYSSQTGSTVAISNAGSTMTQNNKAPTSIQSNASMSERSFLTVATGIDAIHDEVSQSVLQAIPSAAVSRRPTAAYDNEQDEEESEHHVATGSNHESVQAADTTAGNDEPTHDSFTAKSEEHTSSKKIHGDDSDTDDGDNAGGQEEPHSERSSSISSKDAED